MSVYRKGCYVKEGLSTENDPEVAWLLLEDNEAVHKVLGIKG